jgi:glycosyltransferase involved in cell wall biosynthesis
VFLGLPTGNNFGWGICSRYLRQELAKKTPIFDLEYENWHHNNLKRLPGPYFFALQNIQLTTPYSASGTFNCGYTFFEYELTPESEENAKNYDLVLAGSSWCVERLKERNINNTGLLIQGIDPERFYPVTQPKTADTFVLFSGGKFELRKGQDLVLKAFRILHKKYPDMHLVNIWHNMWPESMKTMQRSSHIKYEEINGCWVERMTHLYRLNDVDPERITTYEIYDNKALRSLYQSTDLGVFPNRCEGGTNLVLMEYMACGKPVVVSNATGHTDIVSEENALLLNEHKEMEIQDNGGSIIARWADPSLDELVGQIEYAYHHRDQLRAIGGRAGNDLKHFTWEASACQLLKAL